MAEIKLIALDMDGTLLNDDHEVTEENKQAIAKALDKGVHVVLSTGRSLSLCYDYAKDLNLTSYIIPTNGAEIYTMEKELLHRSTIEPEIMEKLYNIATQVDVGMWMISTESIFGAYRDDFPRDFSEHEWLKFGCYTTDQKKLDILVEEFSKFDGLELTNSLPTNIEVNAKDVSKARALRFVCEKIGITMENVMACGDSLNDIKMIQESGVGIAMANAQEAIKNVADYETTDNNNSGVAKAIEKFVL